jgi:hypothetical protein
MPGDERQTSNITLKQNITICIGNLLGCLRLLSDIKGIVMKFIFHESQLNLVLQSSGALASHIY